MITDSATIHWTEALLVAALRSRFSSTEWALVTQVRDGAGWDRRTFDALAIGLWASRGHPVHGFECKVGRADWKRELEHPEKAEPLAAFCDHWWIVAPKGVVEASTLPKTWGLLVADGPQGPIRTVVDAPRRTEASRPTIGFVAQVIKRALAERPAKAEIEAAERLGFEQGRDSASQAQKWATDIAEHEATRLRELIATFERESGLDLQAYRGEDLRRYAGIVRQVTEASMGWDSSLRRLAQARNEAMRFVESVDKLGIAPELRRQP